MTTDKQDPRASLRNAVPSVHEAPSKAVRSSSSHERRYAVAQGGRHGEYSRQGAGYNCDMSPRLGVNDTPRRHQVSTASSPYGASATRDYDVRSPRYHKKPASKAPMIVGAIAAAVIIVGVGFFAFKGLVKPASETPQPVSAPLAVTDTQQSSSNQKTSNLVGPEQIVMTLGGSQDTYVLKGEDYIESGCHATDKETGSITGSVQVSGKVDTSKVGDYTVTYTATNGKGQQASKSRTVHVVDSMDVDSDGISVLMYHYIYQGEPDERNSNYLEDVKFEEQLQWLSSQGYYYPSYQELRAYIEGNHSLPAKSVVLTFDDGEGGFLRYGIPLLEKYKVPATSFLICIDDDAEYKTIHYASEYCLFESHTYGLHAAGYSGRGKGGRIYDLSVEELVEDFQKSAKILGSVEALAYPFGDYCEEAQQAIRQAGIYCAFTVEYGQVHRGDDPTALQRIRVFADNSLDSYIYQVENGS